VSKIPPSDIVGVTAILLTCSYNNTQEFFRVGYYVNNAYSEEFPDLIENPPAHPDIAKLTRHILTEKPRVTKFQIQWDEDEMQNVGVAPQLDGQQNMQQPELMPDGTQMNVRNDMMSNANLQDAANNFKMN
jgi:histone chaperone ASF1